jgi:hypothetical protein
MLNEGHGTSMSNLFRLLLVLCVAFVATPGITTRVLAHPGHDHKIMGTIAALNGDSVTVKTTKGQERTFEITDKTTILRGKVVGARADLVVGLRVIVNVGDGHEPLKAKSVQYSAPAAKKTATGT